MAGNEGSGKNKTKENIKPLQNDRIASCDAAVIKIDWHLSHRECVTEK